VPFGASVLSGSGCGGSSSLPPANASIRGDDPHPIGFWAGGTGRPVGDRPCLTAGCRVPSREAGLSPVLRPLRATREPARMIPLQDASNGLHARRCVCGIDQANDASTMFLSPFEAKALTAGGGSNPVWVRKADRPSDCLAIRASRSRGSFRTRRRERRKNGHGRWERSRRLRASGECLGTHRR
jgi:hypothetical protein